MTEPVLVNKQRGEISIVLGKTKIVLEPTFENIQNVESHLGRSFLKISTEVKQGSPNFTMAEVASILFMAQKDPKLSYGKIGNLLVENGMLGALKSVAEFINQALKGSSELDESGNQPAEANQ